MYGLDLRIEAGRLCTMQARPTHNQELNAESALLAGRAGPIPINELSIGLFKLTGAEVAPKVVDVSPKALDHRVDAPSHTRQLLLQTTIRGPSDCPGQIQGHGIQGLDGSVVELPPKTLAFFGDHEPFAVTIEAQVMDPERRLVGEPLERVEVLSPESVPAPPVHDHQGAKRAPESIHGNVDGRTHVVQAPPFGPGLRSDSSRPAPHQSGAARIEDPPCDRAATKHLGPGRQKTRIVGMPPGRRPKDQDVGAGPERAHESTVAIHESPGSTREELEHCARSLAGQDGSRDLQGDVQLVRAAPPLGKVVDNSHEAAPPGRLIPNRPEGHARPEA